MDIAGIIPRLGAINLGAKMFGAKKFNSDDTDVKVRSYFDVSLSKIKFFCNERIEISFYIHPVAY